MSQWIRLRVIITPKENLTLEVAQSMVKTIKKILIVYSAIVDVEFEDYKPNEEVKDE